MIIIGGCVAAGLLLLLFMARGEQLPSNWSYSALEKPFLQMGSFCYRLCNQQESRINKLYKKIAKTNNVFQKEQVVVDLHILQPAKTIERLLHEYYIKKLSICFLFILAGSLLTMGIGISQKMNQVVSENRISRSDYGEGEQELALEATIGEAEPCEITFTVQERKYTQDRLETLYEEVIPKLEKIMLNENETVDRISKDMAFPAMIDGYPFTFKYTMDEYGYLDEKGRLIDIPEDTSYEEALALEEKLQSGVVINIMVKAVCDDFRREYIFPVCIYEKDKTLQQKYIEKLTRLVQRKDVDTRTKEYMMLPEQIEDTPVVWQEKQDKMQEIFFIALLLVAFIVYKMKDKELHDAVKEREKQMLMDYPEIISKITLLTGAGLTVRNAFYRIAREYRNKRENGYDKRYAYEEMLLTVYEMESGISEVQAYENYGKRCRVQQYVKFSALLIQNLKKSSQGLFAILQQEAKDSFDIRKNIAKRLGEEAGTKMLFPMILMLGIVMVIIFYPAMASFAS